MPLWWYRFLGRLLYLWVRPRIVRTPPADAGIGPRTPVCYVLQQRHLSNLLVLDHESQVLGLPAALSPLQTNGIRSRRSCLFLYSASWTEITGTAANAGNPDNAGSSRGSLLSQLIAAALADTDFDLELIPVTILWGRAPETQDSILRALFAETWQATSSLRQMLAIMIHGRQTTISFAPSISLRRLIGVDAGDATAPVTATRALRRSTRLLNLHFRRERTLAIGPDLSHRHTQLQTLLATPAIREVIAAEAITQNQPFTRIEATARRYALEIASDYSYTIMQAFMLLLDWASTRVFTGVTVHHFEQLNRIAPGSCLIYVPCHRSYLDGALLSHLLFRRGIMAPHAAAGANLDIPIVGTILRGIGAFFVRRKFKGNTLYTVVFNEYVHRMVERGFPLQYYIEGGRSRSGTQLQARTGMLGMTVRSYLRERNRPLYFVPIYFGYEKLMESASYRAELGGKSKQGESLAGVWRGLRLLRERFGQVYVNFGEPLLLSTQLDRQQADWRDHLSADPQAPWLRQAVTATGAELARRINAAAVVSPVNIVALTLLATPKHTADLRALYRQIEQLQFLTKNDLMPTETVVTTEPAEAIVTHVVALRLASILAHPLGDLLHASEEQSSMLTYARNNVIHLFMVPALVACLITHNLILSRTRVREAIIGIYPLFQAALFLPWSLEQLPGLIDRTEAALVQRQLILFDAGNDVLRAPMPSSDACVDLRQLADIIRLTIERHFLILALLQQHGSGTISRATLEDESHQLAQRLSLLYELNAPEFGERAQFTTVVGTLFEGGLLAEDDQKLICFDARISVPARQTELLLDVELRHSIERLAREKPATDVTAPEEMPPPGGTPSLGGMPSPRGTPSHRD